MLPLLPVPTGRPLTTIWRIQPNTRPICPGIRSRSQAVPTVNSPQASSTASRTEEAQIYDNNTYEKGYTYLGFAEAIDERGYVQITQRNKFTVGETIEIMKPDGANVVVPVKAIYDEEGNSAESAPHPQQKLFVDLGGGVQVYDILRRSEA